ncbi:hypothetical protein B0H10DRAFT_2103852 [Mycena sp. CBHHK59/15]|nr:hypothetical protein B0H10DRAFT_2103852 [Mycena sp. CBHHK59/15]
MSLTSSASSTTASSTAVSTVQAGPSFSLSAGATPSNPPPPPPPPCNDPQGCNTPPPPLCIVIFLLPSSLPSFLTLPTVYTFLSTLIILLLVSGGIIARSVVLRQRQRIAMANGTWMPPGRREAVVHVRAKPVIFDAHVAGRDSAGLEQRWHTMKPFAASTIPPARPRSPTSLRLVSSPAPGLRTAHGGMRNVLRLYNILRSSSPSPLSTTELQSPPAAAPSPPLRVAVFVCMPCSIQGDELPHMEFGVLEAEVVDPRKKSSQSDGDGSAV